jgi:hypothetical protein
MKDEKTGNVDKLTKLSGVGLRLQGMECVWVEENVVECVVEVWMINLFLVVLLYNLKCT